MRQARWMLSTAIAAAGLVAVACGPANKMGADVQHAVNRTGNAVQRTTPAPVDRRIRVQTRVAQRLDAIPGVRSATVFLANRTAYVGIGLEPNTNDARMRSIKRQVTQVTRQVEPGVRNVYVSASPSAVHQLQSFANEIQQGRPVSGVWNRFQSLTQRIWPNQG